MKHRSGCVKCLLVLAFGLLVYPATSIAETFESSSYGYRLDVPQDWIKIPSEVLQESLAAIQKQNSGKTIIYDAGFQHASSEQWLEYPYVLVNVVPYSTFGVHRQINEDEFPKCVRAIAGADATKMADELFSAEARQLLGEFKMDQPRLDTNNRRFFYMLSFDVEGIGPVTGLAVGYFGRDSIVQVLFYSRRSDWDKYTHVRQLLADSFRFNPDKAYSVQVAAANPSPPSIWTGTLGKALVGGIVGGMAAFMIARFTVAKRKTSASTDDVASDKSAR